MCQYKSLLPTWILTVTLLAYVISESHFVTLPYSQIILEGESITLKCEYKLKNNLQTISWTHNGRPIKNSSRIYQVGTNLIINAASQWTDIGEYDCILNSIIHGAHHVSTLEHVAIIWIKTISMELMNENRRQVTLRCRIIDFAEDGDVYKTERHQDRNKRTSIKNVAIMIYNPSLLDNGSSYHCLTLNAASHALSTTDFTINMPYLNHRPYEEGLNTISAVHRRKRGGGKESSHHEIVANESDPLELRCAHITEEQYLKKDGVIEVVWRKDDKVLRQSDIVRSDSIIVEPAKDVMALEISRITINRSSGSLMFNNVIASDEGQYVCQLLVDGKLAVTSDVTNVKIIDQLRFVPQPTSKKLELGSMAKIPCKAQGNPTPQIKWVQNSADALPETVDDINGTLIFRNVSTEHGGNYTCLAINTQGQINATVSVTVVIAPKFLIAPTGIIEVMEMGVVAMHCQAIGDPKPTIQWDKDLKYLTENDTDRSRFNFFDNGTLQISDIHLDDHGQYGCTIGSSAGLKREEVHLIVKNSDGTEETGGDGVIITRAVLITMSVALAYIILVVGLMVWCRYRRRKNRLNETNKDNAELGEIDKENEPCLRNANGENHRKKQANGSNPRGSNEAQKSDDTVSSNHSKNSKKSNTYDHLTLSRLSITGLIQIGRGEFGDVSIGKIKGDILREVDDAIKDASTEKNADDIGDNITAAPYQDAVEKRRSKTSMDDIEEIREDNDDTRVDTDIQKLVLIKALNKVKDENLCQEFKRQMEMFRAISHKGVVRLYGVCRDKDPHLLVLEHTDWGDLKQFLLATAGKVNTSNNSSPPPLKTGQILAVAYQIARGMDAIYRARFIHKDLATRNCVISSDFVVKVSYSALCKDKYSKEYFKHRNSLLPIRWLAPECFSEDEYTTKSDIYSFGVLVWELFNQATKIPFEDLSNEEVIQRSQSGKLDWSNATTATPDNLKEILMSCLKLNPKERPSFSTICSTLSKVMMNGDK